MNILGRMWRRLWREFRPEDESEEAVELRHLFARTALRLTAAFALLFGRVFFVLAVPLDAHGVENNEY